MFLTGLGQKNKLLCHIPDDTRFWDEWPKFRKSELLPFQMLSPKRSVAGNEKCAEEFLLNTASHV
jgi:hypothetical protein